MINWKIDDSWTLFLDRDGVINKRKMGDYIKTVDEFVFLPGVLDAIQILTQKFGKIFIVTNQQGIGKGLMTETDLKEIHHYMIQEIILNEGEITKVFHAPGISSAENDLRKPNPGMAFLAQIEFNDVNFEKSVMVGDTDSDVIFGRNLGMKTVRVHSEDTISVNADQTVNSLLEFAKLI